MEIYAENERLLDSQVRKTRDSHTGWIRSGFVSVILRIGES